MGAALTRSGRLRLLETAFEQGIRHFDTAPLYGMGEAEEVLGRFARSRRDQITITTKFGLAPPAIPPLLRPAVPLARALHRRIGKRFRPSLPVAFASPSPAAPPANAHQLSGDGAHPPAPANPAAGSQPYNLAAMRASLEASLRKLGCDCLDFFLLHEGQSQHLNAEVIATLEGFVQQGKIKCYGLGSGRGATWTVLSEWPAFRGVVQIPDHLLAMDTGWFASHAPAPLFTHSVLQTPLRSASLRPSLDRLLSRWAERTNQDPSRHDLMGEMLLAGGLLNNPDGCVVFSTRQPDRIRSSVGTLERLASVGQPLADLLADERSAAAST
jgi:D-threo-aldose 1-dehydrogenase